MVSEDSKYGQKERSLLLTPNSSPYTNEKNSYVLKKIKMKLGPLEMNGRFVVLTTTIFRGKYLQMYLFSFLGSHINYISQLPLQLSGTT